MLNLRNGQPTEGGGNVGMFHSQWQTYFWQTQKVLQRTKKPIICEIGFGPGYSAIVTL